MVTRGQQLRGGSNRGLHEGRHHVDKGELRALPLHGLAKQFVHGRHTVADGGEQTHTQTHTHTYI